MYIVELIGLPGVGKSTVAAVIVNNLNNSGYHAVGFDAIYNKVEKNSGIKLILSFFGLLSCPILFVQLLLNYTILSEDEDRYKLSLLFIRYNLYLKIIRLVRFVRKSMGVSSEVIVIFDQGVLQCLSSILVDDKLDMNIFCINNLVTKVDKIVFLSCSPDFSYNRLKKRSSKSTRFEKMEKKLAVKKLNIMNKDLISISESAKTRSFVIDVAGDSEKTADTVAAEITCKLMSLINAR